MPKFNFKKSIGRPFMSNVAKPLGSAIYSTATPLVNQGLAQLKQQVTDAFKQLSANAL